MKRPRFYVGSGWGNEMVPMQADRPPETAVPEPIARLAWDEYQQRFQGQEFDHFFHQRGGFSAYELILLLGDALERRAEVLLRERQ